MGDPQIQPHRITKPIQLLAVWMAGLVLLVGSFLTGARVLAKPDWVPPFLCDCGCVARATFPGAVVPDADKVQTTTSGGCLLL